MQDQLRAQMAAFLAGHDVGILSTNGARGAWAMPVRYLSRDLEVECLLPRWADVAYHLEQDPHVLLVVQDCPSSTAPPLVRGSEMGLRWLQIQGIARPVAAPDWVGLLPTWTSATPPGVLYLAVRVTPRCIDLFDESRGWGARETVEMLPKKEVL
ncbi:MAG: pyridoxamine 5'-phosphate oxidase family protein [Chloroflexi bacterium]|nr:pyridoxamine 5'-phosphate oxidase family protein [Chloroflexota bacterium]